VAGCSAPTAVLANLFVGDLTRGDQLYSADWRASWEKHRSLAWDCRSISRDHVGRVSLGDGGFSKSGSVYSPHGHRRLDGRLSGPLALFPYSVALADRGDNRGSNSSGKGPGSCRHPCTAVL